MNKNHYVIIMAGGVGTRFWPMSRKTNPKQFQDILGRGKSLIQETFDRFEKFILAENIYVVTNDRYKGLVQEQLPKISENQILLESVGRNTAPCIAYASYKIRTQNPEACFIVAPADHLIAKEDVFQKHIQLGLEAVAKNELIMTLGIKPTHPNTGYGYIQFIDKGDDKGYHQVKTFTEKPNLDLAKKFLDSGDFLWNGGIFLFSSNTIDKAFRHSLSDISDAFTAINASYYTDGEQQAVDRVYAACKPVSIDYGIMEAAQNVYTIPADIGWSDLGTWGSVYENSIKDTDENTAKGQTIFYDSTKNIVHLQSGDKMVVIKGLEDFIVVDTENALLICPKKEEQFIKTIVGDLKSKYGDKFI